MLTRALIVFLVILNLGVAAWWIARSPAPDGPVLEAGGGLELLDAPAHAALQPPMPLPLPEAPEDAVAPGAAAQGPQSSAAPAVPPETVAAPAPPALKCYALGPYADAAAARSAIARLGARVQRSRVREQRGEAAAPSAFVVFLPPAASREEAQATAQRIIAAGFSDLLVINSGEQANGVALGRYSTRARAEQRQAALRAAGFPAQMRPVADGQPASTWWAEVALRADARPAGRTIDCAGVG